MKHRSNLYLACSALGLMALALAPAPQANANDSPAQASSNQQQQFSNQRRRSELVKIVQQATAQYYRVEDAEAAGYHLLFGCVSGDDSGAMGLHYVNLPL